MARAVGLPVLAEWPMNIPHVADAVTGHFGELPTTDRDHVPKMNQGDLIQLPLSLGPSIRNRFCLHQEHDALLGDCGGRDPDDASSVMLRTLWTEL